ncbi:MAG: sugar phosphate isomerase/epimerase [Rhodospirillaceae bacterium]|nr:sugar phosphate isomerase/epimerase [Rhodospirillaceae bacterium]
MTVYVSSGAFQSRSIAAVVDDAVRLGITHVELSSGLAHAPALEADIRRGMDLGLTFLVHNYFPAPADPKVLNLTASDPDDLAWSIAHCKRAIDLSLVVGGGFYSLHSGYAAALKAHQLGKPDEQAEAFKHAAIDRDAAYTLMIRSVREVADYAGGKGKSLLLENNVISPVYLAKAPANPLLMTDAAEIVRFMKDVDRTNVGFLIDTGHTKVSGTALGFDPHAFLDAVAPYVRALHLSDNDGREDQNLPFDENAWFYPRLKEFRDVPWVLEAYKLDDDIMKRQVAMLGTCKAA